MGFGVVHTYVGVGVLGFPKLAGVSTPCPNVRTI